MTAKSKVQSIEPNIADMANSWLKSYELDYKLEQESLNTEPLKIRPPFSIRNWEVFCCYISEKLSLK